MNNIVNKIQHVIDTLQPIRSVGQVKKIAEEIDNITNPDCVVKIVQDNSYHYCYLTYEKIENNSWIRTYICDGNVVWEPETVTTYELADNLTNEDNVMSRVTVSERNITTVSELNSILESLLENTTNLTKFNNYTCSILEGDVISFTDFKRQKEQNNKIENGSSDETTEVDNSLVKDYSNNETKTGDDVEVGDILYVSWGYDMTIVDFYRVIQRKKASINLEKLESKEVSSNKVMPIDKVVPDSVVDGKTFRISRYGVCKIDGRTARYWKGNPMYSSDMD